MEISACDLCPRNCGVNRNFETGFCGGGSKIKIARAALHFWEEPCISGENGSGTVFFSGCNMKCCFCQNYKISAENFGEEISVERLSEIFIELQNKNAHNINLVNPTHFVPLIVEALEMSKPQLKIPVVYNSSGYESLETLNMLKGYIDIFLPDLKYKDSVISEKYSNAENYFEVAAKAIKTMFSQVGKPVFDGNIMKSGLIIRHLVLPNSRNDSMAILEWISENFEIDDLLISLMSQYTPFYRSSEFPEINRRISTFEYNKVLDKAISLGLKGYMQEKSSAKEEYTPDFDLTGIKKPE